ncbi:alpha/beta hydrolase [Roseovarius sp. PS-C2]|uniref:alpha/beta fold hydrolase n=1 Tax=Roseovarius sp. PS-C2 TaxID=2820814 RepID=UPI001C0D8ECB|nr:alpha/beta hydrolase [Roseovarius sp. PS-C2]MBU3261032.1 alpha/beta hydrolase [Roseovarius sp. PS-C2]
MANWNYVEFGSGFPLLVLHGGKLDHRHMVDAVEPCFEGLDGWRRVYLDLPGCGQSSGFNDVQSQDDVASRVLDFARSISDRVAVIGESRGSYIAQGLAYCDPELIAGLCLIVPGGFPTDPQTPKPEARPIVARPDLLNGQPSSVTGRAEKLVIQTPEIIEKIRQTKVPAAALHDVNLEARVTDKFLLSYHDEMLASRFDKPSLVLSGRQDSISGYADTMAMIESYPRATYGLLDTAGHSLSWERPALFKTMLRDWLKRLTPET